MKKHLNRHIEYINEAVFRASFLTFVVLAIMELVVPGFVTSWFNPIFILCIALVSFLINLFINEK